MNNLTYLITITMLLIVMYHLKPDDDDDKNHVC